MMYAFIRVWAFIFLRLYFRKTIIYGRENVPAKGPLILASNHPSAFMEASVLATVMKRPIHFLVRGDMFHPRFHWLFEWTKQIPIYRKKDGIANLRKNAASFDLTHRKLGKGEAVLIFPEAKTTLEKK
ncbi:MAG TPA: 1-acyl-sn-glycerol-3-phosphate acyltransferase [Saprospiraceae bacterium]|nr:1-acyl-sn-glycerol-3-phosphate acyltransferase [Saprospiraceae bacterium]